MNQKKQIKCPNTQYHLFLGPEHYTDTYFIDLTTNQWTPGPNMSFARHMHTCNLITKQSGEREIVIVGGLDWQLQGRCAWLNTVEIIDVDTKIVRNGNSMKLIANFSN